MVDFCFLDFDNQDAQIAALRLLCCLLPIPNRDTLKVLLEFLAEVARCSEDSTDENGVEVSEFFYYVGCCFFIIHFYIIIFKVAPYSFLACEAWTRKMAQACLFILMTSQK